MSCIEYFGPGRTPTKVINFPAGTVETYAALPDPSLHPNETFFVKAPRYLSINPRGFYISDGVEWTKTTNKVDVSEDAGSVLNWTDWAAYRSQSRSVSKGDLVVFEEITYVNFSGVETSTNPKQDNANWDIADNNIIRYYNDLGVTIDPFTVLHLKSVALINGRLVTTPDIADSSKWEFTQGTLTVACETILPGEFGCSIKNSTKLVGGDTSLIPPGSQLWLSADGSGKVTDIKPSFPDYSISVGGNYNQEPAPNGEIIVSITKDIYDTFNDGWDGSVRETFDFRVTSDGVNIVGTLTNGAFPSKDLTLIFSDGFYTLDTTTIPKTVSIPSGTATAPLISFVYIDQATKTLQASTLGFPETEHAKIATIGVFDAVTTQTDGAIRNQNINDHIKKETDNGHILHITERLRAMNAEWANIGCFPTLSGTPNNLYFSITEGAVWQLHKQIVPAQDMQAGDEIHVVNDPVSPYRNTLNLNDITSYSTGNAWNNDWSNIVLWGVANKTGEASHLMVNLPSDGYNSEENAIADRNNFTNYTIPNEFKGVGFLIGRFTIRRSGTTFTYNTGAGFSDLRGFFPNNTAGGSGSSGVFAAPQYTTTQRDALSPENGWIIYNTTTNLFEFYENGAWVNK